MQRLGEQAFMFDQMERDVEGWNLCDNFCEVAQIQFDLRQEYLHNEDFSSSVASDILDLRETWIGVTRERERRHSEGLRRKIHGQ